MLSRAISSPPTNIFARNPTQVRAARSERIIVELARSDEHFGAAHSVTAAPHFHPWPGLWVKWVEEEEGKRLGDGVAVEVEKARTLLVDGRVHVGTV